MTTKAKFLGLVALLAATPAWAIPISTVGQVDKLLAETNLGNAGNDTEKEWVASVLGLDVSQLIYEEKTNVNASNWEQVTGAGSGIWAFDLKEDSEWFLIKTGNIGGGQTNRFFLFENLPGLDYAVVRLADMGITSVTNVGKISHVGEFNGPGGETNVPEPTTLSLFGLGLLGLGLIRRRRRI